MFFDKLENHSQYHHLHPDFAEAFHFLLGLDDSHFREEKTPLRNDEVFALLQSGKGIRNNKLENHRRYIDIHYTRKGVDHIGWKSLQECVQKDTEFDPEKDFQLWNDPATKTITVSPGEFAIFFPEDAHCPLSGEEDYQKVVFKIEVE